MMLPAAFVERVLGDLGPIEGRALCEALDGEAPVSVRLNPDKTAGGCMGPAVVGAGPGMDARLRAGESDAAGGDEPSGPAGTAGPNGSRGGGMLDVADAEWPAEHGRCAATADAARGLAGASAAALLARELPDLNCIRPVPWCRQGYYLATRPSFTCDPDFHAGAYYVQEASSQFVDRLLAGVSMRGARVLDLCAAPGGKATLYASLVGPDGLVVANEIDRRRAAVLADNVRKWGTGNVVVTCCEPRALGDFEAWFDVVAVDAPCSGEGMFRKDPASRGEWSEGNVRTCAARQDAILRAAWRALRPGGTLVYSTCTFHRDEDEGTLERMLRDLGGEAPELVDAPEIAIEAEWGIVCGRVGAFRTFRFFPHRACGEGFFAAVARKSPEAGGRPQTPKARRTAIGAVDRKIAGELARWVREPERMRFGAVGDTCFAWFVAQAEAVRVLAGAVPVLYSGVALGQVFKGSLKPDPALAWFVGLDRRAVPVAELDREQALCYLSRGEVAADRFAPGVNLVCARGRALGFAKRIGARVNNLYPHSLRIRKEFAGKDVPAEPETIE